MKSEQVRLCEGEAAERWCRADTIVLPDIRFQGLFVSREEQEVINFAYKHAVWVQKLILTRDKRAAHQEQFEIDIPDLWFIATRTEDGVRLLRAELRDEIVNFSMLFQGLVHHFLPHAKCTGYSYDGKTRHGVKYKGAAWVSK